MIKINQKNKTKQNKTRRKGEKEHKSIEYKHRKQRVKLQIEVLVYSNNYAKCKQFK